MKICLSFLPLFRSYFWLDASTPTTGSTVAVRYNQVGQDLDKVVFCKMQDPKRSVMAMYSYVVQYNELLGIPSKLTVDPGKILWLTLHQQTA